MKRSNEKQTRNNESADVSTVRSTNFSFETYTATGFLFIYPPCPPLEGRPCESSSSWCTQYAPCFSRVNYEKRSQTRNKVDCSLSCEMSSSLQRLPKVPAVCVHTTHTPCTDLSSHSRHLGHESIPSNAISRD